MGMALRCPCRPDGSVIIVMHPPLPNVYAAIVTIKAMVLGYGALGWFLEQKGLQKHMAVPMKEAQGLFLTCVTLASPQDCEK